MFQTTTVMEAEEVVVEEEEAGVHDEEGHGDERR